MLALNFQEDSSSYHTFEVNFMKPDYCNPNLGGMLPLPQNIYSASEAKLIHRRENFKISNLKVMKISIV